MKKPDRDNLRALFERFMSPAEAESAAEDVQAGDEMLRAHPAPEPDHEMMLGIKLQMAARLSGRHRTVHHLYRLAAGVAAVVVLSLIAFHSRAPQSNPGLSHAALIPTLIWESDDISADDIKLAYFTSEIRQIEAQVQALEAGESQDAGVGTLDEVEMELAQINTAFWKE